MQRQVVLLAVLLMLVLPISTSVILANDQSGQRENQSSSENIRYQEPQVQGIKPMIAILERIRSGSDASRTIKRQASYSTLGSSIQQIDPIISVMNQMNQDSFSENNITNGNTSYEYPGSPSALINPIIPVLDLIQRQLNTTNPRQTIYSGPGYQYPGSGAGVIDPVIAALDRIKQLSNITNTTQRKTSHTDPRIPVSPVGLINPMIAVLDRLKADGSLFEGQGRFTISNEQVQELTYLLVKAKLSGLIN